MPPTTRHARSGTAPSIAVPALIARCLTEGDVQAAVRFAGDAPDAAQRARRRPPHRRQRGRRGRPDARHVGHAERSASTSPKRTARVGPGALLADFDREAQAHGLATPLGINSTTGVAGLTLGGGFGWLTRRHGMTIDNLLGATVVTADGAIRGVSATREPDLFWALRGGGGNFGVVTSFEFQLHPVGPEVYAGLVVYPFAQARQVLRAWRDFTATRAGRAERLGGAAQGAAAALPAGVGARHRGRDPPARPLRQRRRRRARRGAGAARSATRSARALGPTPYAGFQTAFDPLLTPAAATTGSRTTSAR